MFNLDLNSLFFMSVMSGGINRLDYDSRVRCGCKLRCYDNHQGCQSRKLDI